MPSKFYSDPNQLLTPIIITDELRSYIDQRAGDNSSYATPSEYLRDLIRKDMAEQGLVSHVLKSIDDVKHSRFSENSILDIMNED